MTNFPDDRNEAEASRPEVREEQETFVLSSFEAIRELIDSKRREENVLHEVEFEPEFAEKLEVRRLVSLVGPDHVDGMKTNIGELLTDVLKRKFKELDPPVDKCQVDWIRRETESGVRNRLRIARERLDRNLLK